MRAVRLPDWKSDLQIVDVPEPEPGPGEVVIKVGGAGLCHSDLHLLHDFEPGMLPWPVPFTLGHENAGWVHAVGEGVSGLATGTPVAVFGGWGCGRCRRCASGFETYCEDPANAPMPGGGGGLGLDGGLAEFMRIPDARLLLPLPDGLDPAAAAPLTDAGLTPYHAIRRSWPKLAPGSTALVIGVGGLGHVGIQILKATTAARVIAVDVRPEALELAERCGADLTLLAGEDAAARVKDATGGHGAEVVLDFVGNEKTIALGATAVRVLGDLTIVGVAGGTFPWNFFAIPYEVSMQTTYWGSRFELAEVLDLGARGLVTPSITTFSLDEAPQAYRRLAEGRIEGRAVVVP
jgi:alcohol dehydrogenase, propanol-preferring